MATLEENIRSLTPIELALVQDIIGLDNSITDLGAIYKLKLHANATMTKSSMMLFKKLVKGTKYERVIDPILNGNCGKLGKLVNKYYAEKYDRFITIVSALAYKNKHWLKNIIKEEYSQDWGEKHTKNIVQSFGTKDWLTIVLFCADELTETDEAIEAYTKDLP